MRYKVVDGSESAHCCFNATVVDTQTPCPAYPEKGAIVCECFNRANAQRVVRALNAEEDAVDMDTIDKCVAAATKGEVKMGVSGAERCRQQHIEIADTLNRMSKDDKLRLAKAFRQGWDYPYYDPCYVDKVLDHLKAKYA